MAAISVDEERKIVRRTLEGALRDIRYRQEKGRTDIINRTRDFWEGRFYKEAQRRDSHRRSYSSRNLCFPTVEDGVPLLTDTDFRLVAEPRRRDVPPEKAEAVTECLDWTREQTQFSWQIEVAVRDMLTSGLGVLKTTWDPEIDYPYGGIVSQYIDPAEIYLDSSVKSLSEINRVTHIGWRSIHEMCRLYPDKADDLMRNRNSRSFTDFPRDPRTGTQLAVIDHETDDDADPEETHEEQVKIYEQYTRDTTVLMDDEEGEYGVRKKGELVAPGRWLLTVVSENVLLCHVPVPYWDGKHPFTFIPGLTRSHILYPFGILEFILDVQDDENRRVSRINDWIRKTVHTLVAITLASGLKPEHITNLESGVITTQGSLNDSVQVISPPSLPQQVFNLGQANREFIELVSGFREVLQGREPRAGESGKAIQSLQDFALSRARLLGKHVDLAVTDIGRKQVSRLVQYWPMERTIKIAGRFEAEDEAGNPVLDQSGQPTWTNYRFRTYGPYHFLPQEYLQDKRDAEGNSLGQIGLAKSDEDMQAELSVEPLYDITIENGAAAAVSRQVEREDALLLHDRKVFNDEDLLMAMRKPRAKEIAARNLAAQQPPPQPPTVGIPGMQEQIQQVTTPG